MTEEDSMYNLPPYYDAFYVSFCELLVAHQLRPSQGITIATIIMGRLIDEIEKDDRYSPDAIKELLQIQIDFLIDLKKVYVRETND